MTPWDRIIDPSAVLQAASESIIVTTADLAPPGPIIVYVNPAFEKMTGWAAAEIRGKSPRVLQGDKTDHSLFKDMRRILQSGGRWEGQAINYRKDGSEFVMEWSITPVSGQDRKPHYYVAVQRDVTARIEAERKIAEARALAEEADRKKMNLARYFSPRTVEVLAGRDEPLGKVRRQHVAILIIDIIGFTAIGEKLPPERVVALLRSFYRRMAAIIFEHEGSIEHFAGDALMAVFGVPDVGKHDATNAVKCAIKMVYELERWNRKRLAAGRDRIEAGITAHYGVAVLGDIGTRQSMSFTVIGDTVNTTSRIQELCRSLHVNWLVTYELIEKVKLEAKNDMPMLSRFFDAGAHVLRGRSQPIRVFALKKEDPEA
jgi:PAS domain S-box-containing protein